MNKRSNLDHRSTNEELARRLFQRDRRAEKGPPKASEKTPEPLASRREPGEGPQTWSLGRSLDSGLAPVSERERRALFAALSRGTRANLGREPTVAEFVGLVEEVDRARALVSSSKSAIEGRSSVYLDEGRATFRGSKGSLIQERGSVGEGAA